MTKNTAELYRLALAAANDAEQAQKAAQQAHQDALAPLRKKLFAQARIIRSVVHKTGGKHLRLDPTWADKYAWALGEWSVESIDAPFIVVRAGFPEWGYSKPFRSRLFKIHLSELALSDRELASKVRMEVRRLQLRGLAETKGADLGRLRAAKRELAEATENYEASAQKHDKLEAFIYQRSMKAATRSAARRNQAGEGK